MIIDSACNIFNWKKLNEKQIIAVWTIVIIPRIKYQLAAIVLNKMECISIMARLNVIIKKRAGLMKTTPNFVLYEKEIYGENKNIMFLENILEADRMTLIKWKHLCKEKGIKNEYIRQAEKNKIHIKYFDENEKPIRNKNENSRIIERRKEEDAIKPFEMLNNIMLKNEWLNKYSKEERKDKAYNERIEMMDNLI
ncbi:hypothetical protein GLOIN_2v1779003 [Rhizophagus irregularis DAOM 181602=DAOM 197198]|nr:hypothetical protein GLOIN_2v1779003 [Rhizophagus irregularis DAOM 181602=DAOM 197198]